MSLKRIRAALERHDPASPLSEAELHDLARQMGAVFTDDELREMVASCEEDLDALADDQLLRIFQGVPYEEVVG